MHRTTLIGLALLFLFCSGSLSYAGNILESYFDTGNDGFSYGDDTFRGTNQPTYADGAYTATGGYSGGGLQVTLGNVDNSDISGATTAP